MGVTQVHNLVFLRGTFCNIKQVNIIWEDAGASEYYIEVSTDGENYTKIAEAEGMGRQQNRNDTIILSNMSNARYVRIVGTARNTNQRPTSSAELDRKSTRLNSSHRHTSRMPSSA